MRWNPQLIWTDILAVHAALLHTGEILFFTGNEFWEMQHKRKRYDHVRLFNCQTLEITQVGTRCDISDLFCCGHAFTGNGDLLAAGGTKGIVGSHGSDFHAYHWDGERRTWLFDASTKQFIECAPLNINPDNPDDPDFGFDKERSGGRWYPTLITLGSGQILAIGGHPDVGDDRHSADRPEYFEWNSWRYAEGGRDPDINFNDTANPLEYPRLHLLPDGKVFCSTPFWGNTVWWYGLNKGWTPYFTVTPNTNFKDWHWEGSKDNDPYYKIYNQFNGTSVLLPLLPEHSYAAKVMVHGSENSYLIDLSTPQPAWRKVNGRLLSDHRLTVNSVILPTGEIFFCGGVAAGDFSDQSGVQRAEIYNPDNREWSLTTAAQVVRNYHSVALLMPDGRVWTAGSSKNQAPNNEGDNRELRIEIFEPSYYGSPTRPIIHEVIPESGDVNSGIRGGFTVITDGTNEIKRVAVVRNGSVTHGFSSDQRYVGLPFTTQDHPGGLKALRVSIPDNPNIVVPGYYMLFLIDKDAIPSVGKFINIRLLWSDWFEGREDDCVSTPAVASFGKNRLDVFAKRIIYDEATEDHSINEELWHKWWTGTRWTGWESIGKGAISSAPAAVSRGENTLDVFARGMHNEPVHKSWDGNTWSNWRNLGGEIGSAPAAVFHGNIWHIFARGLSGELAYMPWDGVQDSNWNSLGGQIASAPAAVFHGNIWHIFARGLHDELAYLKWDGVVRESNWEAPYLGGPISSAPCVIASGPDRIDVFARGLSNQLVHKRLNDSLGWGDWANLGGVLAQGPAAVSWGFDRIDVVAVSDRGNLLHKYW